MNRYATLILVGSLFLVAQTAAKKSQGEQEKLGEATVVSVAGQCEKLVIVDETENWLPIQKGEKLKEMTVVRTGFRSKLVLKFEDRGEVIVRNGTEVGISEFRRAGQMVRTKLGLKYGRMNLSVDSSRGTNDFRVKTPVALLSVRGTSGEIAYHPGEGLRLGGETGTWRFEVEEDLGRNVKPGEITDENLNKSSDIKWNYMQTKVADAFGMTNEEMRILRDHGSGRGFSNMFNNNDKLWSSPTPTSNHGSVGSEVGVDMYRSTR